MSSNAETKTETGKRGPTGSNIESKENEYKFTDFEERLKGFEKEFSKLKILSEKISGDFQELKESTKLKTNFIIFLVATVLVVFVGISLAVGYDYLFNNEKRYEKFIDKTEEVKTNFYTKFYTREELKPTIENSENSEEILNCLKNKGYFSNKCFE